MTLLSPLAVTGCKQMINYARDHTTADTLDYIALWNAAMLRADDIKESYIAKSEAERERFVALMSHAIRRLGGGTSGPGASGDEGCN